MTTLTERKAIDLQFAEIHRIQLDIPKDFHGMLKLTIAENVNSPAGDKAMYHVNFADELGQSMFRAVWQYTGGTITTATPDKKLWWMPFAVQPGKSYTLEIFSPQAPAKIWYQPNMTKQ